MQGGAGLGEGAGQALPDPDQGAGLAAGEGQAHRDLLPGHLHRLLERGMGEERGRVGQPGGGEGDLPGGPGLDPAVGGEDLDARGPPDPPGVGAGQHRGQVRAGAHPGQGRDPDPEHRDVLAAGV
ncbi:hypothetical protein [Georgenia sp. SUBG003]|uniref:hypothetical protein n=1 Tax=Georgenia sp. SUBG003 TaxID=1497974 RepID=UPI003AB687EF